MIGMAQAGSRGAAAGEVPGGDSAVVAPDHGAVDGALPDHGAVDEALPDTVAVD